MAPEVLYEVSDGVAIVTINRPEKRNALNLAACETLKECWRRIENDPDVRVGIVTGAGDKAFCAGFDITEKNVDGRPRTEDFTPRPGTSPATGKPLIAAVNGLAMAAGMALVEACDLCVAADHAWFSLPEVTLGIGLEPFVQSLWTLPQRMLFELLVTGDRLSAERAYQLGFVNRIAPGGDLMDTALERYDFLDPERTGVLGGSYGGYLTALGLARLGARVVLVCRNAEKGKAALEEIARATIVPVIGVIEPGARAAVKASRAGKIGVIGTEATIASGFSRQTSSCARSSYSASIQWWIARLATLQAVEVQPRPTSAGMSNSAT